MEEAPKSEIASPKHTRSLPPESLPNLPKQKGHPMGISPFKAGGCKS